MRKTTALALLLAAGLSLGACGTNSTGTTGSTGDATTDAIINGTVKACGFLPAVSTVTSIIASFVAGGTPINDLVVSVARSICGAVSPPKTAAMARSAAAATPAGPPMVAGVRVEGRFVR
jgi:hypothetical protein